MITPYEKRCLQDIAKHKGGRSVSYRLTPSGSEPNPRELAAFQKLLRRGYVTREETGPFAGFYKITDVGRAEAES